eukprot:scaffold1374_cov115-Isochrysis_galbana.AAC.11
MRAAPWVCAHIPEAQPTSIVVVLHLRGTERRRKPSCLTDGPHKVAHPICRAQHVDMTPDPIPQEGFRVDWGLGAQPLCLVIAKVLDVCLERHVTAPDVVPADHKL